MRCLFLNLRNGTEQKRINVDFPSWVVESFLETLELFVRADVQIEFQNLRAPMGQQFLETVDQFIALFPDRLGNNVFHPDDEYIFILGTVENVTTLCQMLGDTC